MQMIRHQTINRTKQTFAGGSVKHQFPETLVKSGRQPAFGLVEHRQRPEHNGVTLIMLAGQTRQVERPVQRISRRLDRTLEIHDKEIRDSSRRLLQIYIGRSQGDETQIDFQRLIFKKS